MPMKPGYGSATIRANIQRETRHGKPQGQAVAMSMSSARESAKKRKASEGAKAALMRLTAGMK